jgi:uncharacterized delta-60 repeat protein
MAITLQSDGKIIVGGMFTTYNSASGTVTARRIIRLNTDGTKDTSFDPTGIGFNGTVFHLSVQSDGKILVGGNFSAPGSGAFAGNLGNVARLNSDGSLDNTFNPTGTSFNGSVMRVVPLSSGKILVGGSFTQFVDASGTHTAKYLIRLNSDGTFDNTFNASGAGMASNLSLCDLAVSAVGKIYVGGYTSPGTYNGTSVSSFFALNSDGTLDTTFNVGGSGISGANGDSTLALFVQSDQKVVVGGMFDRFNNTTMGDLFRVLPDGTLD